MPHTGLDAWMALPEETRKAQELQMQSEWNAWMGQHKEVILETVSVGKPKRITATGVTDARNDIMMYSVIEAESHEQASQLFKDHPHFGISGAWIEVMAMNKDI